jgi:hypothetical protein
MENLETLASSAYRHVNGTAFSLIRLQANNHSKRSIIMGYATQNNYTEKNIFRLRVVDLMGPPL